MYILYIKVKPIDEELIAKVLSALKVQFAITEANRKYNGDRRFLSEFTCTELSYIDGARAVREILNCMSKRAAKHIANATFSEFSGHIKINFKRQEP